ncbi:MAG: Zn-dependent hydrolase [Elusimicrobia bacterium RIFOXYB2_FULL_62_6]|nr:MAG: Zn-dependent hydrolase [Elusimicrobia bacterium RIFOXYB2_FULL_62_6]
MEDLEKKVHWLGHSSFRLESQAGTAVYIDPYNLKAPEKKADVVLITHAHFDHFSPADIGKVAKSGTRIFGPEALAGKVEGDFTALKPGDRAEAAGVAVEAVPAYNTDKNFHPKASGFLGYVVDLGGFSVYHAGDTDLIEEMKSIKADAALLPVSGTYTMDASEACRAAQLIKPKVAVPMHYGSVVGSREDAIRFRNLCGACEVVILEQEK